MKHVRAWIASIVIGLILAATSPAQDIGAVFDPDPAYIYYKFAFDPIAAIVYVGNFTDPYTAQDVDLSTLLVNGSVAPTSTEIQGSHPDFDGAVVKAIIPAAPFLDDYGAPLDTTTQPFEVTGSFTDGEQFTHSGYVDLIGKSSASGGKRWIVPPNEILLHGDVNVSGAIDVDDVVAVISFAFGGGTIFGPFLIADCNCSHSVDVDDAIYLIDYIFDEGPVPCHY
jgi:hypothetical protein